MRFWHSVGDVVGRGINGVVRSDIRGEVRSGDGGVFGLGFGGEVGSRCGISVSKCIKGEVGVVVIRSEFSGVGRCVF